MDLYNIITKIPYIVMLGVGLVIVLQVFVGGLNDLSVQVDDAGLEEYDKALAAEGILNLGNRRGFVPIEYFENEGEDPGFERSGGNCHFDEIQALDGANLTFRITSEQIGPTDDVQCQGIVPPTEALHTRILLEDENLERPVPATVSIYEP